jgi:hypothetical protein
MNIPTGHTNGKDNSHSPGVATLLGDARLDPENVILNGTVDLPELDESASW